MTISISLLYISVYEKNNEIRSFGRFILVLWLIYFSGFRNGLGFDYVSYIARLDYFAEYSVLSWIDEPTFNIIALVIQETLLSNIFYFLALSVVTISLIIPTFYKYPFPFYSILIFLLSPGFGLLQTFNGIRQFAAIAFFFYGSKYIYDKKLIKYIVFFLLGFMFHKSILFLFPLYFIINKNWNRSILLIVLTISLIFPDSLLIVVKSLSNVIGDYSIYLDYNNENTEQSYLFMVLSLGFVFFIFNKRFFKESTFNLIFNMAFLCVIFYNFSISSIIFSRVALYFSPFLCVLLAIPNPKIPYSKLYRTLFLFLFFAVFFYNLYQSIGDPILFPNNPKILPISSIID